MYLLLIDRNPDMIAAWRLAFEGYQKVTIKQGDLTTVISCDAIVSPANSFGYMDGGVDYAISERLGWDLQEKLQASISERPVGELLVGEALVLATEDDEIPYLISAPTMRVPMNFNINTSVNAYLAMKATMHKALKHPAINSIAVPGFCTGVGRMPYLTAAEQMAAAYTEVVLGKRPDFSNYSDAQKHQRALNTAGRIFD